MTYVILIGTQSRHELSTGISLRWFIIIHYVLIGDTAAVIVLKKWRPMLYNGIFGWHGKTYYVILLCVPILRSIGTKLTNLENMQKSVLFDDTWRKNGTSYVMIFLIGISIRNILKPARSSNVMAQTVAFMFLVTLTLTFDLCYISCHTHWARCIGISMRSFIRIRPVLMGDYLIMPRTHTNTQTQTHRRLSQ